MILLKKTLVSITAILAFVFIVVFIAAKTSKSEVVTSDTVTVDTHAGVVWSMIQNPRNYPIWLSDIKKGEITRNEEKFKEWTFQLSTNETLIFQLVNYEKNRLITLQLKNPPYPLIYRLSIELKPGFKRTEVLVTEQTIIANLFVKGLRALTSAQRSLDPQAAIIQGIKKRFAKK